VCELEAQDGKEWNQVKSLTKRKKLSERKGSLRGGSIFKIRRTANENGINQRSWKEVKEE
jgi:hypothetical protein